jgi:hypothetical protein
MVTAELHSKTRGAALPHRRRAGESQRSLFTVISLLVHVDHASPKRIVLDLIYGRHQAFNQSSRVCSGTHAPKKTSGLPVELTFRVPTPRLSGR